MARELPYRNKPTPEFSYTADLAQNTTFYVVNQQGPLQFIIKNDQGNQFKTRIGTTHYCSCGGGVKEHCIHTIWILLKLFKVPSQNPLIWQLSYVDSELTWILNTGNRQEPKIIKPVQRQPNQTVQRIDPSEDGCCSICQEDFVDSKGLTWCKQGCGHNFHNKCMKVWADHKQQHNDKMTCPLCRTEWTSSMIADLRKQMVMQKRPGVIRVHKDVQCSICHTNPIRNTRFHCIQCDRLEMCQTCFNRTNHPHDFISKEHFNAKWIPVIRQSAFTDILGRELTDADYQTLINLDNPPTLPEFLADKLPNSPDSHCSICETHTPASMKFLPCEHSAHESCLISDFRANINKCHTCKAIIHRGLLTLRARNVQSAVYTQQAPRQPQNPLELQIQSIGRPRQKAPNNGRPRKQSSERFSVGQPLPSLVVTRIQPPQRRQLRDTGAAILSR